MFNILAVSSTMSSAGVASPVSPPFPLKSYSFRREMTAMQASVLPVTLVSIVPAVCPLLRGGQQLPCLLLVFSDNGLSFLLLQLPICHLIHIVAFFRQREVGYKSKREALWASNCKNG